MGPVIELNEHDATVVCLHLFSMLTLKRSVAWSEFLCYIDTVQALLRARIRTLEAEKVISAQAQFCCCYRGVPKFWTH